MGVIYSILEALIPFEFIDYAFMKNALIAIILVTPVFAILGTMTSIFHVQQVHEKPSGFCS